MKKIIFILALLVTTNAYCTLDTINAKSKITNVTVFFNGAQITRNADVKLTKGKHIIKINNLPREINPQSIQVERITNCKILSVKHQYGNNNENKKSTEQLEIQKKIDEQEFRIKDIRNNQTVYDLEEKILLENSNFKKKDDGAALSVIKEAADFYRTRLNEIRLNKLKLNDDLKAAKDKIQELYVKLNEITSKNQKEYSMVLIAIEAEKELTADLNLKYYIEAAGWKPLYDFRVDDITKPLSIVYNANVFQSTGEEWNNVNIKLSTGNPLLTGSKPELIPWYIDRKNVYTSTPVKNGQSIFKGQVLDSETNEAIPFATVIILDGNRQVGATNTDLEGHFTINPLPVGSFTVKITYVGYNSYNGSVNLIKDQAFYQVVKLQGNVKKLEEVVIADYKSPSYATDKSVSGYTVTSQDIQRMPSISNSYTSAMGATSNTFNWSNNSNVGFADSYNLTITGNEQTVTTDYISSSLKSTVTHLEYTIDIPYTIPSDGEEYNIKIKEVSLPVIYEYYVVPKIDKDAFLIAKIKDWNQLNLLSGKTSIYYQGTFTGESMINDNNTSDTMNISLGRDRNIIVKREGNKEMSDKRIMGSNIKETIGWDITIKNNKDSKIKIIVEDQYPISEKKSIEVNLQESSDAKTNEKTGKLSWFLSIEPDAKATIKYKYTVKYPKETNLNIE